MALVAMAWVAVDWIAMAWVAMAWVAVAKREKRTNSLLLYISACARAMAVRKVETVDTRTFPFQVSLTRGLRAPAATCTKKRKKDRRGGGKGYNAVQCISSSHEVDASTLLL